MLTITRKINGLPRQEYVVYTQEEANALGIRFKHWTECTVGDYASSDDGYVQKVFKRREYHGKTGIAGAGVSCIHGYGMLAYSKDGTRIRSHTKFLFENCYQHGDYWNICPRDWKEREAARGRVKNVVKIYVGMLLSSGRIDWDKLGELYRPNQQIPRATVKRLFKLQKVKQMVDNEINAILETEGVTDRYVVKLFKEAADMASQIQDVNGLIRVAENFAELRAMYPQKKTASLQIQEYSVSKELEDSILREEKKLRSGSVEIMPPSELQVA